MQSMRTLPLRTTVEVLPQSEPCSYASFTGAKLQYWAEKMRPYWDESHTNGNPPLHRKIWEWAFIASALADTGMLKPGKLGLGFGVGKEPLVPLFASLGCQLLATDQSDQDAESSGWKSTNQFAGRLEQLNDKSLCSGETFNQNVKFRTVDMRYIPGDLRNFDFNWSSCAFEHLGSIENGIRFINKQLDTLKPGGIAIHTTEFNISSNLDTVESGPTVLFRRRDFEFMQKHLERLGHEMRLNFTLGNTEFDLHVDKPPWQGAHLRLESDGYVITSFGIVIRKSERAPRRSLPLSFPKSIAYKQSKEKLFRGRITTQ